MRQPLIESIIALSEMIMFLAKLAYTAYPGENYFPSLIVPLGI